MSYEYVERRIKEALKISGGNRLKAREQIIAWTYEDNKLLHALAKPHLSGIVAYNVERVDSGRAEAMKAPPPPPEEQPEEKPDDLMPTKAAEKKVAPQSSPPAKPSNKSQDNTQAPRPAKKRSETFGLEILKAATGSNPTIFGLEDSGVPRKRQGASQSHIDTMKAIAALGQNKSKRRTKKTD